MAEYLLLGDVHLSDRPPSSCTDTYQDDIFAILAEIGEIARRRNSAAVIWAGDVFHVKTPGRTSHKTVMRTIAITGNYPCPVYVVPGNHDMLHDRLDSIDSTQPLGVVIASGAVAMLNGWVDDANTRVFGLPWLQTFTTQTVSDALRAYRADARGGHPSLVVTHAPLYPPGQELVHEFFAAEKWATAMDGRGSVYYGHVHEPHGIWTAGGVTFCNAGAISRGSLHEHNLTRPVQIASWDSNTGEFELLDVPHRPADEVFRLVDAHKTRTARRELGQFLDAVGTARLDIASIEAVLAHVRSLHLDPAVESTISTLLEEAQ